jgi:hypothetical protein
MTLHQVTLNLVSSDFQTGREAFDVISRAGNQARHAILAKGCRIKSESFLPLGPSIEDPLGEVYQHHFEILAPYVLKEPPQFTVLYYRLQEAPPVRTILLIDLKVTPV